MKKIISWWISLVAFALAVIASTASSWFVGKYFPNWIIEYQLAFTIFAIIIVEIVLTIIVKIIYHDCGDECRNQYDIKMIRSQYRKRK